MFHDFQQIVGQQAFILDIFVDKMDILFFWKMVLNFADI
jgi:hypothetical protein